MEAILSPHRVPMLDARLKLAAGMAHSCRVAADIGADHGRLSAVLLLDGRVQHMLTADISEKALSKARKRIAYLGLAPRTTFAVADGLTALDALPPGTVDTVFILGMGGGTLRHILSEGASRLHGATLILGAQTDLPMVRQCLCDIGYRIREEAIAQEKGRSYILMRCTPAQTDEPFYNERQLLLGPVLLEQLPDNWLPLLTRRKELLSQAVQSMETAALPKDRERLALSRRELAYLREALEAYQKKGGR